MNKTGISSSFRLVIKGLQQKFNDAGSAIFCHRLLVTVKQRQCCHYWLISVRVAIEEWNALNGDERYTYNKKTTQAQYWHRAPKERKKENVEQHRTRHTACFTSMPIVLLCTKTETNWHSSFLSFSLSLSNSLTIRWWWIKCDNKKIIDFDTISFFQSDKTLLFL